MSKYQLGVAFEHPELLSIAQHFEQRMQALNRRYYKPVLYTHGYDCECDACGNCHNDYEPPEPPAFDSTTNSIHGSEHE